MVAANLPNPRSGLVAPATTAAMPRPSGYLPPARPNANPFPNLGTNPSQPGFSSGLPQPTDPRRAAAAKLANPMPAAQIGHYPGHFGIAPATASGSGQYPMAATGLGAAGGSGQFGAALPADHRPDPRKAARTNSAFRPAGGFPGVSISYLRTWFAFVVHTSFRWSDQSPAVQKRCWPLVTEQLDSLVWCCNQ